MTPELERLLGSSVVSFLLSYMLMRAWLPFAPARPGEVQLVVPLTWIQRVLVYRWPAMILLAFIIVGSLPMYGGNFFLPGTQGIALLGLLIVVTIPLRYEFTDLGVALNKGPARAYRLFRKFDPRADVRQGRTWLAGTTTIILHGRKTPKGTNANQTLYIPTSAVPEVTRFLRRVTR